MTYTVIYEKGPTSWGAYVPDLPSVITVGDSRDEVERLISGSDRVSSRWHARGRDGDPGAIEFRRRSRNRFCRMTVRSRTYFVRVNPGKSWGDTFGFSGASKGPFATAEFYRLEKDRSYRLTATAPLLNPVAPVDFFVTDRGFLVTLDNWHNIGFGTVAAFYSPDGHPDRPYDLSGLVWRPGVNWTNLVGSLVAQTIAF